MRNTNQHLKIAIVTLMAGLYNSGAMAATGSGDASVVISQPIAITTVVDAVFGSIAAGTVATAVTISTGNALSVPGGAGEAIIIDNTGAAAFGFSLSGVAGQAYTLSIVAGSLVGTGTPMAVNVTVPGALPALTIAAAPLTFETILTVGANQTAGTYSTAGAGTSIAITANYN